MIQRVVSHGVGRKGRKDCKDCKGRKVHSCRMLAGRGRCAECTALKTGDRCKSEECRLLGCGVLWLFLEPMFRRNV
jgi:hypothetical protein